jgi:hypothetical protein
VISLRVLGINGIRSDGSGNTDRALQGLERLDHCTVDTAYPLTRWVWQTRSRARELRDARVLKRRYYHPGDAVIAHSRGCRVNLRMMELGCRFSTVFWFRPAMNRDVIVPDHGCERLFVLHHPEDRAIALGSLLPWHPFGAAGRFGLEAGELGRADHDPRVRNVQLPRHIDHDEPWRHSCDFLPPHNLALTVHFCDQVLSDRG